MPLKTLLVEGKSLRENLCNEVMEEMKEDLYQKNSQDVWGLNDNANYAFRKMVDRYCGYDDDDSDYERCEGMVIRDVSDEGKNIVDYFNEQAEELQKEVDGLVKELKTLNLKKELKSVLDYDFGKSNSSLFLKQIAEKNNDNEALIRYHYSDSEGETWGLLSGKKDDDFKSFVAFVSNKLSHHSLLEEEVRIKIYGLSTDFRT